VDNTVYLSCASLAQVSITFRFFGTTILSYFTLACSPLRSDSVIKITDASVNVSCMQNCPKLFIITSLLSLFKSNTILAQPSTKKKK